MQLNSYRIIFVTIGLIGILLFASPTIGLLINLPSGEQFSELYLLGSNYMMESYPLNIKTDMTYSFYLGVGNHEGSSSYYTCYVKLANTTVDFPKLDKSSMLPVLYEYKMFIVNEKRMETPLVFKVNDISFSYGVCELKSITINGKESIINKMVYWDSNRTGFYYDLFVELWLFNKTSGMTQFNNRFVYLILNMTLTN